METSGRGTTRVYVLTGDDLDAAAERVSRRWGWFVAAGVAAVVLGVILLANPFTSARVLALLVALGLLIQGIDEIVNADRYHPRWPGYLLGTLLIATGIWAVAWPGITLWVLAVVVGVGFVVTGLTELMLVVRYHHELPNRGLFLVLAVSTVVLGILAVVWPKATIIVLAVVLGLRVLFQGLALVGFGLGLRRMSRASA